MMEAIIIAAISSSAFASIISGIFSVLTEKRSTSKSIINGVQQLMFDRIKHICKFTIQRGYISSEDLQDLERMHQTYHNDLKGNGYLDELMRKVRDLPIMDSREAKEKR